MRIAQRRPGGREPLRGSAGRCCALFRPRQDGSRRTPRTAPRVRVRSIRGKNQETDPGARSLRYCMASRHTGVHAFPAEKRPSAGPGVPRIEAGMAFFIYPMRILRDLEVPVPHKVVMQINSDEEVGSESSRALTEKNAKRSQSVLVLEPGTGLEGKLKTARKGIGDFTVTVRGKAAHSGLDFTGGASAVLELARQIEKIAGFTDLPGQF